MRESWPELQELVLVGLKGSDHGPMSEGIKMWEEDEEENDMIDAEEWTRPKGLRTLRLLDPGESFAAVFWTFEHL
jgi:hypothetical protein